MKLSPGQVTKGNWRIEDYSLLSDPIFWRGKAETLHRAANILFESTQIDAERFREEIRLVEADPSLQSLPMPPSVVEQGVMLAAYTLENLFKGLMLYENPDAVEGGELKGGLKSHDLLSLAASAQILLSPEETQLCKIATEGAVYWGRYPVPVKAQNGIQSVKIDIVEFPRIFNAMVIELIQLYAQRFLNRKKFTP